MFCISVKAYSRDKELETLFQNANKYLSYKVDSAIICCDSIIKVAIKNDKHTLAEAYTIKAHALYQKGDYPQTLVYLQKSLTLCEEGKYNNLLLSVYNLYGTFFNKQNDSKNAQIQFTKAYKLACQVKDSSGIAGALNDIGTIYQLQNKMDSATANFTAAFQIYSRLNIKIGASYSLGFLAEVWANQNKFDRAIFCLDSSLVLRKELNDSLLIAVSYVNLGETYLRMNNNEKALEYFFQSVEMAKKIKYVDLLKHCYKMISDIYYKQNNFQKAYDYYNLHVIMKDSLFNEKNSQIVKDIEAKYQNEKKQLQIENLDKQNEISRVKIEKQFVTTRLLVIGFVLLLVIAFTILIAYRNKRNANKIISIQKKEVEIQRDLVQTKSKEITDSIYYAQRIQRVLLAGDTMLKAHLPEYFILYKPKDIVSGDFYWANTIDDKFIIIVADCTGHGVPGAFMSLLNISFLNQAVNEKKIQSPELILDHVREQIINSLNPFGSEMESKDGMDATICMFDFKGMWLRFSCANNPLWLIRNNELKEFAADKMPVGMYHGEQKCFSKQTLGLRKGDVIYMFTDGYADQFGGAKGKKFKYKQLKEKLVSVKDLSMEEQKRIIDKTLEDWKGNIEQVDDILIIGIRV